MAMAVVTFLLGVCFLTSLVEGKKGLHRDQVANVTSIIELTESNFDEKIANKHLFVLFYGTG